VKRFRIEWVDGGWQTEVVEADGFVANGGLVGFFVGKGGGVWPGDDLVLAVRLDDVRRVVLEGKAEGKAKAVKVSKRSGRSGTGPVWGSSEAAEAAAQEAPAEGWG
jgi:hypothetical protein